eukprot:TRINITY_DN597_c0_g1_i2.p1 TRINITY_DN597_c0_g1~~TRINITY_DN597_c0_g1_i2.p1  ORF type:complete len:469 (+),score=125.43 TRINITY_DN597_c0_g1_i2:73-1479(+)
MQVNLYARASRFLLHSTKTLQRNHKGRRGFSTTAAAATGEATQILQNSSDYNEAQKYFKEGKYRLAEEFLKRTEAFLKVNQPSGVQQLDRVLREQVVALIRSDRFLKGEKLLERVIEMNKQAGASQEILCSLNTDLVTLRLQHDFKKAFDHAISLGKEYAALPNTTDVKRNLRLVLGTTLLMNGNLEEAKEQFAEILDSQPDPLNKGYTFNNLAVALWWAKHPVFYLDTHLMDLPTADSKIMDDKAEKIPASEQIFYADRELDHEYRDHLKQGVEIEFDYAAPFLKRSLYNIEREDQTRFEANKKSLVKLLSTRQDQFDEKFQLDPETTEVVIRNRKSATPLANLAEFFLFTNTESPETRFWFKYLFKFYQEVLPENIDRAYVHLAFLCGKKKQYNNAEAIFKKVLERLKHEDNYQKMLCLRLYGQMLSTIPEREDEGKDLLHRSYVCLLYTSPSPRDRQKSRMPSSA